MPALAAHTAPFAALESVRHRVSSSLVEGFSEWWQMPALVCLLAGLAVFVLRCYRRDAAGLSGWLAALLVTLRLWALAAIALACLDFERRSEHEIVSPSRVAILVDTSASMALEDVPVDPSAGAPPGGPQAGAPAGVPGDLPQPPASRSRRGLDLLDAGGLLAALGARHEVSLWRFDADAQRLVTLPRGAAGGAPAPAGGDPAPGTDPATPPSPDDWREGLVPRGSETRVGEAVARVLEEEPATSLAGIIVISDGANTSGLDPESAAAAAARAGVPLHTVGIGADTLPANVRIADLVAPARVFPGDPFAVTAHLQAQGLAGRTVRVELRETPGTAATPAGAGREIDVLDARLGPDGELTAVRFDVAGLSTRGPRSLVVRVVPPAEDRTPADDVQAADIEVVERITQVLIVSSGPGREYQFLRNLLHRDRTFAVDVLLGTATSGVAQDARRMLDAFPASDEALAAYDAIVAIDPDWRLFDAAAQPRLERWVARESGGLVFVAGGIFAEPLAADPLCKPIRGLLPVEFRRHDRLDGHGMTTSAEPMRLAFTRDGEEAEFLWLAASRAASQAAWSEFAGVHACLDAVAAKPGATVYARVARGPAAAEAAAPIYLAGQFYGSGTVLFVGSGELWRLRAVDDAAYERVATQLVRHAAQGRLLRGGRRVRLLVDRDRYAVGATVSLRVVAAQEAQASSPPTRPSCVVRGPDGAAVPVPLVADAARPGEFAGGFIAPHEGVWQIEVAPGDGTETVTRRVQVRLPDRELVRPRLDRRGLERLAAVTGGAVRFMDATPWTPADSARLAALLPDRTRRDYEAGAADADFKRRLNAALLGVAVGLLSVEWIVRRLVKLA